MSRVHQAPVIDHPPFDLCLRARRLFLLPDLFSPLFFSHEVCVVGRGLLSWVAGFFFRVSVAVRGGRDLCLFSLLLSVPSCLGTRRRLCVVEHAFSCTFFPRLGLVATANKRKHKRER